MFIWENIQMQLIEDNLVTCTICSPSQQVLSRTIAAIDQAGKCCVNEPQHSIIGVVYLVSETEHL